MREKRILLRLVEAMNLINEYDRARPILPRTLRIGHYLLDLFDSGQHRGEFNELRLGHVGDDLGESGLASSRRPPEEDGPRIVALNRNPQRLARPDQMILPHILV